MGQKIKALRGMPDVLPGQVEKRQDIENTARALFALYGYCEIRTPVLEDADLFTRSIGEETDIVQKQMYAFKDRGDRLIALRPEGTAPVARSYLENNLAGTMPICRLYYIGPMFRSERPQAGRLRQFYQIGVEAIGPANPYIDAEVICLMMKIIEASGLKAPELKLNTLGCKKDKVAFGAVLKKALGKDMNALCEDCAARYEKNVLRIFDCKNESCQLILRNAPKIIDHICQDCKAHFEGAKGALTAVKVDYTIAPSLVRGLDYYTGTVFEAAHKDLGPQDAVAAGGRYNNLIGQMGGGETPACGFAIGLDRLVLALRTPPEPSGQRAKIELFLILLGEEAKRKGFSVLSDLRDKGIPAQADFEGKSLKSQMRLADRVGAKRVLIIGDDELKKGAAILRDMDKKEQKEIRLEDAADTHVW